MSNPENFILRKEEIVYDFIVVGQGIAGTLTSHFLLKNTSNILVVDAEKHSASFAAAGIINPVTGRKYVKSWLIDTLLPFAINTYDELNKLFNIEIYQKLNVLRTLHTVKEQNDWDARKQDEEYSNYILQEEDTSCLNGIVNSNNVYGEISSAYQVKLKELILAYRGFLKEQGKYLHATINATDIKFNAEFIDINGLKTKQIIFCEGYKAVENPFFNHLPFQPAKGNAMIIKGDFQLQKNLRDNVFITPLTDGSHWVGSNYKHDYSDENPDEYEQNLLAELAKDIIKVPFVVVEKLAGIRPTMQDRRPVLGRHKEYNNVFIFNGLGTKGSSLAPYFAHMLVNHIFHNTPIIDEVII